MPAHRIREGWHPASAMTDEYDVQALPIQPGQRTAWFPPVTPSERLRWYGSLISDTLDLSRGGIGGVNLSWYFNAWTPSQAYYWRNRFLPDGFNGQVTIVTEAMYSDGTSAWVCLQVWMRWNDPADAAQPKPGSGELEAFRIDFDTAGGISGGEAPMGGGFSSGFSSGFNIGGIPA